MKQTSFNSFFGWHFNKGRHPTEEMKRKMSLSLKGRHFSEEHIRKLKEARKLQPPPSEETRKKISDTLHNRRAILGILPAFYGKHHTEETKRKLSEAIKGKYTGPNHPRYGVHLTEETKKKISKSHKGLLAGSKHPLWGKHPTEETRKKIRDRRTRQIFPIKDTKIEVKIQQQLKALEIDFIAHHYMNIQHAYRCDIYIPIWNTIIECDGIYWHKYPIGKEIDHLRTKELMEKGYKVLRLWEHEIKEMTAEDLKKKLEEVAQVKIVGGL